MGDTYCVYVHTNKANGKRYVGITSRLPEIRWKNGHAYKNSTHFNHAIEKYGWDGFTHEILHEGLSHDDACSLEIYYINKWNLCNGNYGYNLTHGGEGSLGVVPSAETRRKQSIAKAGGTLSEEHKKKIQKSVPKKAVAQYTKDGKLLAKYESVRDAARKADMSSSSISACCKGLFKYMCGYIWKYVEDDATEACA